MCSTSDADTNNSVALLEDRVRGLEERQQRTQQVIAQQGSDMAAQHALVDKLREQLAAAQERQAASMDSMREQVLQHMTDSQQQTIQQLQQLGQGPMQPRGSVALPSPKQQQRRQQTSVVQPQQQPLAPPPPRQQQREQPTPQPTPPPATFKEAVGGAPPTPQDQPMADAPGRRPRPPFPHGADLVGTAQVLRSCILKGRKVPALVKG